MTTVHHLNCGTLRLSTGFVSICHCLLLEDKAGLALIDVGLGLQDIAQPLKRLGQTFLDRFNPVLQEQETAIHHLESLNVAVHDLNHIVLTHGDVDHVGGLSDFPGAKVHLSDEELAAIASDHSRYDAALFDHGPDWQSYGITDAQWFGLEARPVNLGFSSAVYLIPLFGHTAGHCGVAVQQGDRWLLHAGDTYYVRDELLQNDHPAAAMSAAAAVNNAARLVSVGHIKRLLANYPDQIEVFCTHDPGEFTR